MPLKTSGCLTCYEALKVFDSHIRKRSANRAGRYSIPRATLLTGRSRIGRSWTQSFSMSLGGPKVFQMPHLRKLSLLGALTKAEKWRGKRLSEELGFFKPSRLKAKGKKTW